MTLFSTVGAPATVRQQFAAIVAATAADELILSSQLFDPAERRESHKRIARLNLGNWGVEGKRQSLKRLRTSR